MRVLIGNTHVQLDTQSVLGVGGEGTVLLYGKYAVKLYRNPSALRATKLQVLLAMRSQLPIQKMAYPLDIVRDPDTHEVIGMVMPYLGKDFVEIGELANRQFRVTNNLQNPFVVDLFLDGHTDLVKIHKAGVVVGDLNAANEAFRVGKPEFLWHDIDSWQVSGLPCLVGTEMFLDPLLYDKDLTTSAFFRAENDWYSFAVLLFRSLLFVHPYGGVHKIKKLTKRAQAGISVLDSGVVYPKFGLSPDVLSDDLANVFHRLFSNKERFVFPEDILRSYRSSLRSCRSCGVYFPSSRGACPACSQAAVVVVKPVYGMHAEEFLRVQGNVVFSKVIGATVYVVTQTGNSYLLYTKTLGQSQIETRLFGFEPGSRFEIFDTYLVRNRQGSNALEIYDISVTRDTPKLIASTTTSTFALSRKAVFRASANRLYRIAGATLMGVEVVNGRLLERPIRQVMENQTWFTSAPDATDHFLFGMSQVMDRIFYWGVKGKSTFDISMPSLKEDEVIDDISVAFSSLSTLVRIITQEAGIKYLHVLLLDEYGEITSTDRKKLEDAEFPHIHGSIYSDGVILHATDDGLTQEKVNVLLGRVKKFAGTSEYLQTGSTLHKLQGGVLVVNQNKIIHLRLG